MEKISELTEEQEQKVNEYRERFFGFATSTKPGNKELVSQAAVRLAELAGLANCEVKFVSNPEEGDSLSDSVSVSISGSFRNSVSDSLRYSIWVSLLDSFSNSLCDSVRNLVRESLSDSVSGSIRNSIRDLIRDSLWDSFYDSGWTALYSFMVEELGIECTDKDREILSLYREIAENASAVWIAPGAIIICDKPSSVEIKDGNLISAKWEVVNRMFGAEGSGMGMSWWKERAGALKKELEEEMLARDRAERRIKEFEKLLEDQNTIIGQFRYLHPLDLCSECNNRIVAGISKRCPQCQVLF